MILIKLLDGFSCFDKLFSSIILGLKMREFRSLIELTESSSLPFDKVVKSLSVLAVLSVKLIDLSSDLIEH